MLPFERSSQRTVICLGYDAFPHPLPELGLRGPKLLAIPADYQGRLLFFLFLLVFVDAHLLLLFAHRLILYFVPIPLRG